MLPTSLATTGNEHTAKDQDKQMDISFHGHLAAGPCVQRQMISAQSRQAASSMLLSIWLQAGALMSDIQDLLTKAESDHQAT